MLILKLKNLVHSRSIYCMKLLSLLAGLSGVWSDKTNDLTMCNVPCCISESVLMQYVFISRMARIGFENSHLAGILLLADRIHIPARPIRYFRLLRLRISILVEILRINLDFRQPHDTVSTHRLFGAHTRRLSRFRHLPIISPVAR